MLSHRCCIVVTASKFRSFEVLKFPPKSNLVALSNDSLDSARMGKSVNSIYCTTAIVVVSFVCWPLPFANTRHDVTTSKSNKSNVDSITNHDDDAPATGDRRLSIASTNDACTQYGIQCIFFVCSLTWCACLLACVFMCLLQARRCELVVDLIGGRMMRYDIRRRHHCSEVQKSRGCHAKPVLELRVLPKFREGTSSSTVG